MPSLRARQLCPDAIFVDGHYSRYAEMSQQLRDDPAVGDAARRTDRPRRGVPRRDRGAAAARPAGDDRPRDPRQRVSDELSLDCSVGVGRSKMVAKLASRAAKPTADRTGRRPGPGVVVVRPDDELAFLHPLPVEALWGVGPATAKRLHDARRPDGR